MKILKLNKIEINSKSASYQYDVIENGSVIASRRSSREYVACFVVKAGENYKLPHFFSDGLLIGKGDSRELFNSTKLYAVATLNGESVEL